MKPIPLVERAINNSTSAGAIVLDLFGGSGTTMFAADRTGRAARLMELDPKFVDVIRDRWDAWEKSLGVQTGSENGGAMPAESGQKKE